MMFLPQIGDVSLKKHQKHKKQQKILRIFPQKIVMDCLYLKQDIWGM